MRNKMIFTMAAVVLVAGTAYSASATVRAQENFSSRPAPLIDRMVKHFNLNGDEVQMVVDQAREDKKAEVQARYEEYLDQAVKDGDITVGQKQVILDKHNELIAEREKKRVELQAWAEENEVDLRYLFGRWFSHHRGMGMYGMHKL